MLRAVPPPGGRPPTCP